MRAFFFACAFALGACGAPSSEPAAQAREPAAPITAAATLTVSDAWAGPTPGGVEVAAGYLTITNATPTADRLVSITSPRAARVEAHDMTMDNGVMRMRSLEDGLPLPAGQTVTLAPGGMHLMFYGVTQPFTAGEAIEVTLTFEHAGAIATTMQVRRPGADSHSGH